MLARETRKINYDPRHQHQVCTTERELRSLRNRLMQLMSFKDKVRATLLYFDLFDHPLTSEEIYTFFPEKLDFADFERQLSTCDIPSSKGMYHVRETNDLVSIRKRREADARTMLAASAIVGKALKIFPFVRGVFLSGSLSKGVNDGHADIDLFIITPENRLWICRSLLIAFKKIFLLNSKKFLCPNYFITEGHLEIPEKNIFTATELVTLRPLSSKGRLQDLLEANTWIRSFYPNFRADDTTIIEKESRLQKLLELPMTDGYTTNWDSRIMLYFRRVWKKRYPQYTTSEREFRFRSTPFSSKAHPNDYQTKVLKEYQRRLNLEKLERLVEFDD